MLVIEGGRMLKRAYYSSGVNEFLSQGIFSIFGEITSNDLFAANDLQANTWKKETEISKRELSPASDLVGNRIIMCLLAALTQLLAIVRVVFDQ